MKKICFTICSIIAMSVLISCGGNGADVVMLEHASSENSAMCLYKFDGEATFVKWIYDTKTEDQIISEINKLPTKSVGAEKLAEWKEPCYGISISDKEGYDITLTYSDGIWLIKDGSVYAAQYDLSGLYERTEAEETWLSQGGMAMPNASALSQYSLKYYGTTGAENENQNIRLSFVKKEGSVITVRLENLTEEEQLYGEYYSLEKEIDGSWYKVPVALTNYGFTDIGIILSPGASREETCDLTMYGTLAPGHYRIEKANAYAEFTIEGEGH